MDSKEALNLLVQVVEQYKGTAHEHRILSQALTLVKGAVQKENVKMLKTDK